jgi:hypothetical protein
MEVSLMHGHQRSIQPHEVEIFIASIEAYYETLKTQFEGQGFGGMGWQELVAFNLLVTVTHGHAWNAIRCF